MKKEKLHKKIKAKVKGVLSHGLTTAEESINYVYDQLSILSAASAVKLYGEELTREVIKYKLNS